MQVVVGSTSGHLELAVEPSGSTPHLDAFATFGTGFGIAMKYQRRTSDGSVLRAHHQMVFRRAEQGQCLKSR